MKGISSPIEKICGAYMNFGPGKYWEVDGTHCLGGRGKYSPITDIIHHFLHVAEANIPAYDADIHMEIFFKFLT